jgi:hypothetical protein
MNENIWWSLGCTLIGPGFAKVRGAALSRAGLVFIRDIWSSNHLLSVEETTEKFGVRGSKVSTWNAALRTIPRGWIELLEGGPRDATVNGEWIGLYDNHQAESPILVFQANQSEMFQFGGEVRS